MIAKLLQSWLTRLAVSAFVALIVSAALFFVLSSRSSYESWQYRVERYEQEFKQSEAQTAQACNKFEACVQKRIQENQINEMQPETSRTLFIDDCKIAVRDNKEQVCKSETLRFNPPGEWEADGWKVVPSTLATFLVVFLSIIVLTTSFVYFFSESSAGWKRLSLVGGGTSAISVSAISAYLTNSSDAKLLIGLIFLVGTFPCAILAVLGLRRLWRWVVIGFRADGTTRQTDAHNYIDSNEPVVISNVAREESPPPIDLTVVGNETGAQHKNSFRKWASTVAWALGGCLALVLVVLVWFLRPQPSYESLITALGKAGVVALLFSIVYLAKKK